jgi:hypothetical protein
LIQNASRQYSDVLITVLPNSSEAVSEHIYSIASEYLSAMAWNNKARVMVQDGISLPVHAGYDLRTATYRYLCPPILPYSTMTAGLDISRIPRIDNEKQNIALTLYREASGSNSIFLSFIFFWQVMEVAGGNTKDFIDNTLAGSTPMPRAINTVLARLTLDGRSLGTYLKEDYRHAIAHIRRKPGRRKLQLDHPKERSKLVATTRIVQTFAELYIRDILGLNRHLDLVKQLDDDFPIYM